MSENIAIKLIKKIIYIKLNKQSTQRRNRQVVSRSWREAT